MQMLCKGNRNFLSLKYSSCLERTKEIMVHMLILVSIELHVVLSLADRKRYTIEPISLQEQMRALANSVCD